MIKTLLTLFFLSSPCIFVCGQQIIKGRIIDENLDIIPGVEVYNDSVLLGRTDTTGYFHVNISESTHKLNFGGIGYEWAAISIPDNCNYLEVILLHDVLYHYRSNRKIDRLRKKRFDKLSELHTEAANNGLFKNEQPCFHRTFKAIKPELDEIKREMKAESKANKRYFKNLEVGDTIRIPFSGSYRYDGTDRTTLSVYSYVVNDQNFDCVIEGILQGKNRRNNGLNLMFKVINTDECNYETIVYEDKELTAGDILNHNMKYFKVLKK